jgi:hypothetical protein
MHRCAAQVITNIVDLIFITYSSTCTGSANDIMAFHASHLPDMYSRYPSPYYVVGDSAYPDHDFMLTPSSAESQSHDVYNFFHSQLRITIERSFGILNTVCGILQKPLKFGVAKSCKVVQACLRIHNYRIDRGCQRCKRSVHLSYLSVDPDDFILHDERYVTATIEEGDRRNRYEREDFTKTQRRDCLIQIVHDLQLQVSAMLKFYLILTSVTFGYNSVRCTTLFAVRWGLNRDSAHDASNRKSSAF